MTPPDYITRAEMAAHEREDERAHRILDRLDNILNGADGRQPLDVRLDRLETSERKRAWLLALVLTSTVGILMERLASKVIPPSTSPTPTPSTLPVK